MISLITSSTTDPYYLILLRPEVIE